MLAAAWTRRSLGEPPRLREINRGAQVGVVGYGKLGKFLVEHINKDPSLQLAWVWNRSPEALEEIPPDERLLDLEDVGSKVRPRGTASQVELRIFVIRNRRHDADSSLALCSSHYHRGWASDEQSHSYHDRVCRVVQTRLPKRVARED